MMKVYTLRVDAKLPLIEAEGIRSTSTSPALSLLRAEGLIDAVAYPDEKEVFEAAKIFLQVEGVGPSNLHTQSQVPSQLSIILAKK